MSVINQVLNQLEMRGANISPEQPMVRPVPPGRDMSVAKVIFLALSLSVVTGALLWQWLQTDKPEIAKSVHVQRISKPIAKVAVPGSVTASNVIAIDTEKAIAPNLQMSVALNSLALSDPIHPDQPSPQPAIVKSISRHDAKEQSPNITHAQKINLVVTTSAADPPMKQISPAQQADAEFRRAVALMQRGRIADALAGYEAALRLDAEHDAARQALVALLLESKRGADAERVLQERLDSKPDHVGFTMMLARLQVERGAVAEATATLEKALPYAFSQADYQAFLAALLQRQKRNNEAIAHYRIALQLAPNNGIWQMGYGISLQELQRNADARVAYQRALDTQTLSPDLQAFVRQKIKGL